jgi:DnaJ-class molecular chaperone
LTILNEWAGEEANAEEENIQEEEFIDWYEILEVSADATRKDIKDRHRELMKKYHPDQSKDESEDNKERINLIQKAYKILYDEEKRKEFDERRETQKG